MDGKHKSFQMTKVPKQAGLGENKPAHEVKPVRETDRRTQARTHAHRHTQTDTDTDTDTDSQTQTQTHRHRHTQT